MTEKAVKKIDDKQEEQMIEAILNNNPTLGKDSLQHYYITVAGATRVA
jgi:hypothetical protein